MKTHANKENAETKEQAASMTEMAEAMRKNCEQALRTSLKFQEEAGRWWSSVFSPATCAQQWQEQLSSATRTANSFVPLAQKPLSEMIELVEKNSEMTAELMKKALAAAQAPGVEVSQAKWKDFWASSLDAARSNADALSLISSKAIDSWTDYVRKAA